MKLSLHQRYFTTLMVGIIAMLSFISLSPRPAYALPPNPSISDEILDTTWDSLDENGKKNAKEVMAALKGEGFSTEAAAGVAGNIWMESNFRNDAVNPDDGSCGFFQFLGGRLDAFKAAFHPCTSASAADTLHYVFTAEIEKWNIEQLSAKPSRLGDYGPPARADFSSEGISVTIPTEADYFPDLDAFKKTNSWFMTTWIWATNWERPDYTAAHLARRAKYAATVLKHVGDVDPSRPSADIDEAVGRSDKLVAEWDLVGMGIRPSMEPGREVSLPDTSGLTAAEKDQIADMNAGDETVPVVLKVIHGIVSAIGILCMLYVVFLMVALALDKTLKLGDISPVKILTRRELTTVKPAPSGTITTAGVLVIMGGLALLGSLLISGILPKAVAFMIRMLSFDLI